MKKFTLLFFILVSSAFASIDYTINSEESNAYFKSQADMLLLMNDEIIGVNHQVKGKISDDNGIIKGKIYIATDGFETDNDTRDSHISEILNAQKFENIIITISEEIQIDNKTFLDGYLSVNGISKKIYIPVNKKAVNEKLIYAGRILVKYSDFNIETPTVAGGLIKKAKEELEIGARITFVRSK